MNAPMNLEDLLREQADKARFAPLSPASVTDRARRIRRRRRAGGVVCVVAVVAVATGGTTVVLDGARPDATPPIAHSPSDVASPSGTAELRPASVIRVAPSAHHSVEQTFNNSLRVPYWAGGKLIAPDGTEVTQTDRPYSFAYDPVAKQWAVTVGGGFPKLIRLDRQGPVGEPENTFPHGVAYSERSGLVRIVGSGGRWHLVTSTRTFDLGAHLTEASVDGFEANGDVMLTVDDKTEVAHLADGTVEEASRLTAYPSADEGYAALIGDFDHEVPGSQQVDADGATGTIRIAQAGTLKTLAAFLAPRSGVFGPWAWEGDDIVTLVFERSAPSSPTGTWTLVRLGTDGYAVGRSASWPGRVDAPPYLFQTPASSAEAPSP